jgi:hypothetical protein
MHTTLINLQLPEARMAAASATELLEELKALRKGRGIHAGRVRGQVGPGLRKTCSILEADDEQSIRQKLTDRLSALAATLPDDLSLAVRVALGLHPSARHQFLQERVLWLGERIDRDPRTVRRRMDEGLELLAQLAAGPAPALVQATRDPADGWFVQAFHAVLRLDRPSPEAIERRVIVAERDGIDHVVALMTLPRDPTNRTGPHDLLMEVLYGVTLVGKEHDTDSRFRYLLKLPTPLHTGERHEYGLLFALPHDQLMRPHYVFTSPRRCDLFDLRVRFNRRRLPERAWRVDEVFHRGVDDAQPSDDKVLTLDEAGELHVSFRDLKPGFGYGAQWINAPTREMWTSPPGAVGG